MFSNINLVDENLNKVHSYAFYLITFSLWSDQFPHNQKDDGVEYGHFIQIFAKILNLELLRQFLTGFYHPCRKYFSCFPQDREIRTIKYIYICDRIFHSSKKKEFFIVHPANIYGSSMFMIPVVNTLSTYCQILTSVLHSFVLKLSTHIITVMSYGLG